MSLEIDVRETMTYTDVWTREVGDYEDEERSIRFRVTDDDYLCYRSFIDFQLDEDGFIERIVSVAIAPPPSIEGIGDLEYEVKIFTKGVLWSRKCDIAKPWKTEVTAGFPQGTSRLLLVFFIKDRSIIDPFGAYDKALDIGELVTIRKSWIDTLQSYLTKVTLVGSDGEVETTMELLRANSKNFQSFPLTKRVEIKEFSKVTLTAFVHFLATNEIIDGVSTTCELLMMAEKYDIPELKSRAEQLLLKNITKCRRPSANCRRVYKVLMNVNPQLLEDIFITHMSSDLYRPCQCNRK